MPFRAGSHFRSVTTFWDKSIDDDLIAVRLRSERQVTFFTLDRGFCAKRRAYAHQNFAAVFVDAPVERFPELVDRFLRHPAFRSHATRMGLVFKISERTIVYWRLSDQSQTEVSW